MAKTVYDISHKIANYPARKAWDKGVRSYAEELFNEWAENKKLKQTDEVSEEITEKDLLNGASDWSEYSYGACALVDDYDICQRLCSSSEQRRTRNGDRRPNNEETWLDVQARALRQAARLVQWVANNWEGM